MPSLGSAWKKTSEKSFEGLISFDDQIYMSAMFHGVFPRFSVTMVDEAQDLSPLNHIMIQKTAAGRIIAVGDAKQAIYAFRGADSNSMQNLRKLRKEWIDLPLATTFRCPTLIVNRQQDHAPGFTAFHTNPQGLVFNAFRYSSRHGETPSALVIQMRRLELDLGRYQRLRCSAYRNSLPQ